MEWELTVFYCDGDVEVSSHVFSTNSVEEALEFEDFFGSAKNVYATALKRI